MQVGLGLPAGIPGCEGSDIIEWARSADAGPFSAVAVIDRIAYDSFEPLVALAAAASVTERVLLATTILISPLRGTVMLAKQLASLDRLSGHRLVLGVGLGARTEDYEVAQVDHSRRGAVLNEQLAELPDIYRDSRIGLRTAEFGGPTVLTGGSSPAAFARMARYTQGYIHGGGSPRAFGRAAEQAKAAWLDLGRPGTPHLWGQAYFAFDDAAKRGAAYVKDYYAFTGAFADKLAAGLITSRQQALEFIRAYDEAGCDHLVMLPAVTDRDQLDFLAEVTEAGLAPAAPGAQEPSR